MIAKLISHELFFFSFSFFLVFTSLEARSTVYEISSRSFVGLDASSCSYIRSLAYICCFHIVIFLLDLAEGGVVCIVLNLLSPI